jgi:hypothetical protein
MKLECPSTPEGLEKAVNIPCQRVDVLRSSCQSSDRKRTLVVLAGCLGSGKTSVSSALHITLRNRSETFFAIVPMVRIKRPNVQPVQRLIAKRTLGRFSLLHEPSESYIWSWWGFPTTRSTVYIQRGCSFGFGKDSTGSARQPTWRAGDDYPCPMFWSRRTGPNKWRHQRIISSQSRRHRGQLHLA